MKRRVAILISGRGSNMAALVAAAADPAFPAEIVLVASDKAEAAGLAHAESHGIPTAIVARRDHPDREAFEAALMGVLRAAEVELVCLAGFMRILSAPFVEAWAGRMLNIHPSLLPAFKGLDTHERALAAGVKVHGATVHFVVPEMDSGPIVAQGALAVRDDDTPATLAARVLGIEHRLYPAALVAVATGAARITGDRVEGGVPALLVP